MTTTAQPMIGNQIDFKIGTQGASPTYTTIGGLTKVTPPSQKFGTSDVTTLKTGFKKVIKGIADYGEVALEGIYESADSGQAAIAAAFATGSNSTNGGDYPFEIIFPTNLAGGQTTSGDQTTFSGPVTAYSVDEVSDPEKAITWKATIKVNSAPVTTLGS